MSDYRSGLPIVPRSMQHLLVDARGYPVPYFVAWINDVPDFRIADPAKIVTAVREQRCYICGHLLGAYKVFIAGPMCGVNRISSEPPSHRACAEFAVRACPFMVLPKAERREANLPAETTDSAGIMLPRNPGVAMLWYTKSYTLKRVPNGILFSLGPPEQVQWYAEGRPATYAEVEASVTSGLPALLALADSPYEHDLVNVALRALVPYYPQE